MNQLEHRRRLGPHVAGTPLANGAVVPFRGPPRVDALPRYRDAMPQNHHGGGGGMICGYGRLPAGYGRGHYGHGHGHGHGPVQDYARHAREHGYDQGRVRVPHGDVSPWSPRPWPDDDKPPRRGDMPPHARPLFDFAPGGSDRAHAERRSELLDGLGDAHRELPPYREGGDAKALNPDLAVVRVAEWLGSEAGKKEAIRALDTARAYVRQARPQWERVPFALWATLDNGLFRGRLSPAVYLEWADPREHDADTSGQTFAPGRLQSRSGGAAVERIAIQLNMGFFSARAFARGDAAQDAKEQRASTNGEAGDLLIAALVHQMVHAWFLRACGPQKKATQADHRLKHAEGFWKLLHAIAELSRQTQADRHGGDDAPRFADTLVRVLHTPLPDGAAWHMPRAVQAQMDAERFDHTVCHACVVDRRGKDEADAWYKKVAGPAKEATSDNLYAFDPDSCDVKPTPRHEKGSPVSYIEVVWDKKPFDYKRKGIEKDFASIKARLADGKRIVTLPRGVDAATFRVLDTFLKSGSDYKPALPAPVQTGIPLLAPPFKKAPRPDRLWLDVRAFKLGTALELPELVEAATARLHSQRTIQSSPLEALAEIYASPSLTQAYPHNGAKSSATCSALDSSSPHDALRTWARRLMLATKPSSTDGGYYASNLCAIERHCGGAGVQGLVASCQSLELEQDYGLCLTQLWERTPKSMHPPGGVRSGGGAPWVNKLPVRRDVGPNTELVEENSSIRHRLREMERENEELRWGEERRRERRRSRDRYSAVERRPWSYHSSGSDSDDDDGDRLARDLKAMERWARRNGWSRSEIDEQARKIQFDHRYRRREPGYRR